MKKEKIKKVNKKVNYESVKRDFERSLSDSDIKIWENFVTEFDLHCQLPKDDKRKMFEDYILAVKYYLAQGKSLADALDVLDVKYLGGFYARPSTQWYPLDDAAKIYPISMSHNNMAVFRLSVYFKEEVEPCLLQMALNFTMKRFPLLATTLKKGFFWHYLDSAKRRFYVQEENDLPCMPIPVSRSSAQSFRLLYFKNRISIEFFHVLADGVGALEFLKVLTVEYLRLKGVKIENDGSFLNINDTPDAEEFANQFSKVKKTSNASGFVDKPSAQMSGKLAKVRPCRILHFKMKSDELKAVAQKYGVKITDLLLAMMFVAIRASTDTLDGEASIQLPVNMRKYYPTKSLRNFSMYCGIRIPLEEIGDVSSVIGKVTEQMAKKTSVEAMSDMLTATEKMVNMLRCVPLAVKQPVAKIVYGFLGDNIFTSIFSNLGVVKLPEECAKHIEYMDAVMPRSELNRATCAAITYNGVTNFEITKNTVDPAFEEKFLDLLTAEGINVKVEGSMPYEN